MKNPGIGKQGLKLERGDDRGQALVETALVLPLLFLLLLGAAELGRVAYAAIEISNAARAGAQYGSQDAATMGDTNGITTAAQNDASNLSGVMASASFGYSCSDSSTFNALSKTCTGTYAQVLPNVTVTTSVSFDPLIHLPFLPNSIRLNGQATEYCLDCL